MPKLSLPTVGRITSPFGPRPKYGDHHGVDYGWVKGTDYVYAAAPGKIVEVYYSTGLGNLITIDIGGGFKNRYCHLKNKGVVKVGQTVKRRQKIGTKGETGTAAFGRHLHFELWRNGTRINPAPYMIGATMYKPKKRSTTDVRRAITALNKRNLGRQSTSGGIGSKNGDGKMGPVAWWLVQTGGKKDGIYSGKVDGKPGPLTDSALDHYIKITAPVAPPVDPPVEPPVPDSFAAELDAALKPVLIALAAIDAKVSALPTAEENGQASRTAIVK